MAVAVERSARQVMTDGHDPVPVAAPTGLAKAGPAGNPRWVVPTAIALVVALVGALVFTIWFGIKLAQGFGVEQGRSNALAAAKDVAVNFTTYDVGTAEADMKRLVAGFTPSLSGEGAQNDVLAQVRKGEVKSTGEVTEAGVISYDPVGDVARVLISVRAQVSTREEPGGQAREYRMEMLMVNRGDWLADRVEFVS